MGVFFLSGSTLAYSGDIVVPVAKVADVTAFTLLGRDANGAPMVGEIAGCGVAAASELGDERYIIRLTLTKDEARSGGTSLWLTGTWTNAEGQPEPISRLSLKTASMASPSASSQIEKRDDGEGFKSAIRLNLSDFETANAMRELMLSGAEFGLESKTNRTAAFRIAGPLPASDRATYLNCTGDLYRPERPE